MTNETYVAGCGIETQRVAQPVRLESLTYKTRAIAPTSPHYVGATVHRHNHRFQPIHRSGNAAVAESYDLLTRRVRWLADNTYLMRRAVSMMCQLVIGEGLTSLFAGLDDWQPGVSAESILSSPLVRFGAEADGAFRRWADRYADVERRRTLYEMQGISARDLFSTGNSLWLRVTRPAPERICPVSWQLLEAEQLDASHDRPGGPNVNRIENGIESNEYGEAVAYYLYDAHPYDGRSWGTSLSSRRVPADRVIHLAMTTRASQSFGVSLYNILIQPAYDEDWLVGHELTSAAIAAGATLLIKSAEDDHGMSFGEGDSELSAPAAYPEQTDGTPHIREVGLTAGTIAHCNPDKNESVEMIESKRPGPLIEPFARFLLNRASMAADLSYHRYTGNPTGASFATLRSSINDDRAVTLPISNALGVRLSERVRRDHDEIRAGMGWYRTVSPAGYSADLDRYQEYETLGPPLRSLNPTEDATAAAARIRSGLSTLRRECGLLSISYLDVLRQLAAEKNLAAALGLVLDFGSGGGGAATKTTTAAESEEE